MRKINVIKGDIWFQWKYGFYLLYFIMVLLYLLFLSLLNGSVKEMVAAICVYSDPAAMGMFFMGAIVLLEKSQKVLSSLAVSPMKPSDYITGKVVSIALISEIVGLAIMIQGQTENYFLTMVGILAASLIFSLCGIIVGTKINTINQYIVGTLPFEIVGFVPVIAYRIGFLWDSMWMLLHPGCAAIRLIEGDASMLCLCICSVVVWILLLYFIAVRCVKKMFAER